MVLSLWFGGGGVAGACRRGERNNRPEKAPPLIGEPNRCSRFVLFFVGFQRLCSTPGSHPDPGPSTGGTGVFGAGVVTGEIDFPGIGGLRVHRNPATPIGGVKQRPGSNADAKLLGWWQVLRPN